MSFKIDFSIASSDQIEAALCERLEGLRLARNLTQAQLAKEAGVSVRTVGRLEKGEGVSFDTLIRIMIALGVQRNLEALLPDPSIRPIERAKGGRERQRARPITRPSAADSTWTWGDDGGDDGTDDDQ